VTIPRETLAAFFAALTLFLVIALQTAMRAGYLEARAELAGGTWEVRR
jgi:hypothetical protein